MCKLASMSSFGTTSRVGYDSSKFYSRRMFGDMNTNSEAQPDNDIGRFANTVLCADSRKLAKIPDSSVHLMVTSPPYNVGKDYDEDLVFDEYMDMLGDVFAETYRLLVGWRPRLRKHSKRRQEAIRSVPCHDHTIDAWQRIQHEGRGNMGEGGRSRNVYGVGKLVLCVKPDAEGHP